MSQTQTQTTMKVQKHTRETLKSFAHKDQTYDEVLTKLVTCARVGCNKLGRILINMDTGKIGSVKLVVCDECLEKIQK